MTERIHSLSWQFLWFRSPGKGSVIKWTFARVWSWQYILSFRRLMMVGLFKSKISNLQSHYKSPKLLTYCIGIVLHGKRPMINNKIWKNIGYCKLNWFACIWKCWMVWPNEITGCSLKMLRVSTIVIVILRRMSTVFLLLLNALNTLSKFHFTTLFPPRHFVIMILMNEYWSLYPV